VTAERAAPRPPGDGEWFDVDLRLVRGELDDLLALDEGLTDRELDFIETLDRRVEEGPLPLTDRQVATLHGLWDRRCRGA